MCKSVCFNPVKILESHQFDVECIFKISPLLLPLPFPPPQKKNNTSLPQPEASGYLISRYLFLVSSYQVLQQFCRPHSADSDTTYGAWQHMAAWHCRTPGQEEQISGENMSLCCVCIRNGLSLSTDS